jgi:hypothetical protein
MWDDFHIHHFTSDRNRNQIVGGEINDVAAFYSLLTLSLFTLLLAAFVFKLIIKKEQEESVTRNNASSKSHLLLQ